MTPENVSPLVLKYLHEEFDKLGTKCKLDVEYLHGGKPWMADPTHWNYVAAAAATKVRTSSSVRSVRTTGLIHIFRPFTTKNRITPERAVRSLSLLLSRRASTRMCSCCQWAVAMMVLSASFSRGL